MNCTEQAVVGPVRTYQLKMRCCYPGRNRGMYSQGPTGWIAVGEDHDTRLLKGKLEPLSIAYWKCLEGPQIPIRLFSSPTVHILSVRRGLACGKRAIKTYFHIDEYCVWRQVPMH